MTHEITDNESYERALAEIEALWGAERGSDGERRLNVLVEAVQAYEEAVWPSRPPAPHVIVATLMEERGEKGRKELNQLLGSSSKASEVLAGKRKLSDAMKVRLHKAWNIPYDLLIEGAYDELPTGETVVSDERHAVQTDAGSCLEAKVDTLLILLKEVRNLVLESVAKPPAPVPVGLERPPLDRLTPGERGRRVKKPVVVAAGPKAKK